jgi:hypothetical protein
MHGEDRETTANLSGRMQGHVNMCDWIYWCQSIAHGESHQTYGYDIQSLVRN